MKRSTTKQSGLYPQRSAVAMAVSAALLATSLPAQSQQVEEIIVTATKREETLKEVPLAITALTGDFTESVNLDDVKDLISFARHHGQQPGQFHRRRQYPGRQDAGLRRRRRPVGSHLQERALRGA